MSPVDRSHYNRLNMIQQYQLCGWIEKDRDHAAQTTARVLAEEASEDLGFPVSVNNMLRARRDLGIETVYATRKGGTDQHTLERISILEGWVGKIIRALKQNEIFVSSYVLPREPE